jgi:hypothetical protein
MKNHRLNLVLPLSLWKEMQELAKRNRRSTTQEIIIALIEYTNRDWYAKQDQKFPEKKG